jgi:hypothetical protein
MHDLISAGRMSGFSMQNPEEHVGDRDTARKNYLRILPSLVQRLRHKRAEVGLYYMLRILVLDFLVPSWLFDTRDFALLVWDFDRSPPAEPSEPGIRSAAKSDTALLCQLGRPAAEISKRFEEGASTSVVTQSGELQGYHWSAVVAERHLLARYPSQMVLSRPRPCPTVTLARGRES